MKNLGRVIDRILRIDPKLSGKILPIKCRWSKYPGNDVRYWKQLLKVLNSDELRSHPKMGEFRDIVLARKRIAKKQSTFDEVLPTDNVIGIIPQNIADRIRKHDRTAIKLGRDRAEMSLTKNFELLVNILRREALLEVSQKKIWIEIRDHFNIWANSNALYLKNKGPLLALIEAPQQTPQQSSAPPSSDVGMLRIDSDMLKKFFKFYNIKPPPGMFPDGE